MEEKTSRKEREIINIPRFGGDILNMAPKAWFTGGRCKM